MGFAGVATLFIVQAHSFMYSLNGRELSFSVNSVAPGQSSPARSATAECRERTKRCRQIWRSSRRPFHILARHSTAQDAVLGETSVAKDAGKPAKKRVVVVGAGWAGLAAAYELSKQVGGLAHVEFEPEHDSYSVFNCSRSLHL